MATLRRLGGDALPQWPGLPWPMGGLHYFSEINIKSALSSPHGSMISSSAYQVYPFLQKFLLSSHHPDSERSSCLLCIASNCIYFFWLLVTSLFPPFLHVIPWFSTERVKANPDFHISHTFSFFFFFNEPLQDSHSPGISPVR